MQLDQKALKGPEMTAAFAQLRKIAGWMDPTTAAQHYSVHLPKFIKGDAGMILMGGWAQGVIKGLGGKIDDILIAAAPQDEGKPCFVLNADSMIFWKRPEADLQAGQLLLAKLMMQKDVQEKYSQTTGSIPVRTDVDLSGPAWSDGQRDAAAASDRGLQEQARAAQPRPQHGAAQPDLGRHDRRHHRVHPQRQGEPRAGRGAARPGRGQRARMSQAGPARGPDWRGGSASRCRLPSSGCRCSSTPPTCWASRSGRRGSPSRRQTCCPSTTWAGLRSYRAVVRTENIEIAYINLVLYGVGFVGLATLAGFVLAVLLDQRIRSENLLRTIFLYPLAVSFVVTGTVWSWLLNPGLGVQKFVRNLGWADFRFDWIIDRDMAIYTIVIAAAWHAAGFAMALFLAGLRSIDPDLAKAAQIDGASPLRYYLRIVLPGIAPIAISVLVILLQFAIKTFDLVRALTGGGPGIATTLPALVVYDFMFQRGQLGRGSAAAVLLLLSLLLVLLPYYAYAQWRARRERARG